jgi:hypothetical protein
MRLVLIPDDLSRTNMQLTFEDVCMQLLTLNLANLMLYWIDYGIAQANGCSQNRCGVDPHHTIHEDACQ